MFKKRFGDYSLKHFQRDLTAGLIVGLVALPLAMAFAIASGVEPENGLYTAIVAGILISLLGGSRFQIGGPTGAFVPLLLSIVTIYGFDNLLVADIGCNAGTQSRCWLEKGHSVRGLDISRDLVSVARERNREFGDRARFEVGSATDLPWDDETFDVCLLPELLEHVDDWQSCLEEAVRVLKRGGSLYVSTTNVLCPVQQEFNLPGYSWYPGFLKRYYEKCARTTRPELVNFASYPAVHWFSPYGLSRFLKHRNVTTLDRFDLIDLSSKGRAARIAVALIRVLPPLRLLGHVLTPSTVLVGTKLG